MKEDFVEYVMSFYGKNGIYSELNFDKATVILATKFYKLILENSDSQLLGDTFDREAIRDIILSCRQEAETVCQTVDNNTVS